MDQSVIAVAVVGATDTGCAEAGGGIQSLGGFIRGGHFEGGVLRPLTRCLLQEGLQHLGSEPAAPLLRIHGDCGDVQLIGHEPAAGHGNQLHAVGAAQPQAGAAEILEFGSDAIKIAIGPGAMVRVGQLCRLRLGQHAGDGIELHGQVSWVETSSYILVFGILLLASHNG